eukprot:3407883-Prymnesium_polylepis.2
MPRSEGAAPPLGVHREEHLRRPLRTAPRWRLGRDGAGDEGVGLGPRCCRAACPNPRGERHTQHRTRA